MCNKIKINAAIKNALIDLYFIAAFIFILLHMKPHLLIRFCYSTNAVPFI